MLMPMVWTDNNDVDELMNDMVYEPWTAMETTMPRALSSMFNHVMGNNLETTRAMKTDVVDEGKDYKMTCDLPGFNKEDVKIDMKNGILNISASHKENKDEKDKKTGKYLRRERSEASYQRSFNVGEDVKPEEINAKYENGVLTLTIPKKAAQVEQKEDAKQIEVH